MKKFLLLTSLLATSVAFTNAQVTQCTPDPNYTPTGTTGAGIKDLECAKTNTLYNTSTTIVIPTVLTVPPTGTFRICSVKIDNITNWPTFTIAPSWAIYEGSSQYAGGQWISITDPIATRACVSIEALFTQPYNDSIVVQGSAKVSMNVSSCAGLLIDVPFSALDANNGGLPIGFVVADNCTYSEEENTLSNNSFDVAQNFPNPVDGSSQITFNVPNSGKVTYRITNLLGSVIAEKQIAATAGKNQIDIAAGSYASGVYMYSLTFNGQTITKRMIVK